MAAVASYDGIQTGLGLNGAPLIIKDKHDNINVIGVNGGRVPNGSECFATLITENLLFTFIQPKLREYKAQYGLLTKEEQAFDRLADQFNQLFLIKPEGNEKIKPKAQALEQWLKLGPLDAKKLLYS